MVPNIKSIIRLFPEPLVQAAKKVAKALSLWPPWFTRRTAKGNHFVDPDFDLGQIFFDRETAESLVAALDHYQNPCCLCTPRLAQAWFERGRTVRLLDIDERFAFLPGFRRYDILNPEMLGETFDVIIFDPVFHPAERLVTAVDALSGSKEEQPLFVVFPVAREDELKTVFSAYGLVLTEFQVSHCNVKPKYQDHFRLYGNRPLS